MSGLRTVGALSPMLRHVGMSPAYRPTDPFRCPRRDMGSGVPVNSGNAMTDSPHYRSSGRVRSSDASGDLPREVKWLVTVRSGPGARVGSSDRVRPTGVRRPGVSTDSEYVHLV
jgi:hypothetical protein